MVADTNTALLGLLLMGTGNDNNSWGDNVNNSITQLIENAIAGNTALATTGGATVLTAAQARSAVINITGALVSDATITVPNLSKIWKVFNNTSGAFAVLFKTAAGTAVNAPKGKMIELFCDGANGVIRGDRHEVGNLFYHAGTTVPAGSFECDGSTYIFASYPDLNTAIGAVWGNGNGATTKTLPDGYTAGRYLRSRTASVAVGVSQAEMIGPHTHTASATVSGTNVAAVDHTHANSLTDPGHDHSMGVGVAGQFSPPAAGMITDGGTKRTVTNTTGITITNAAAGAHNHVWSGTCTPTVNANTGTENRPVTLVGMLCIRY